MTRQLDIWTGKFGSDYTTRNAKTPDELNELYTRTLGITRTDLNRQFLDFLPKDTSILEVGCNVGLQMAMLRSEGFTNFSGIDAQEDAVTRASLGFKIRKGNAQEIPFPDNSFDLVFTSGVLIHLSPRDSLDQAMKEIFRVSKKYIWGYEYYSDGFEMVPYKGKESLLWMGPYAQRYLQTLHGSGLRFLHEKRLHYIGHPGLMASMFLLEKEDK